MERSSQNINYPGVAASVAGLVGLLGIYSDWWESPTAVFSGTADVSGLLALAMTVGLLVFGGASVVMSDPQIRKAMNMLFTLCAVVLTLACVWGLLRSDNVGVGAEAASGIYVSVLGGLVGIAAGLLAMRPVADATPAMADEAPKQEPTQEPASSS